MLIRSEGSGGPLCSGLLEWVLKVFEDAGDTTDESPHRSQGLRRKREKEE